jgi:hypothetical protein
MNPRGGWAGDWRRGQAGQALSEYVIITGMLALIGISMAATLHAGVKDFVRHAVAAVRTVAP